MQEFFDAELKKMKVRPYYFPLFVTENVLQKEKDHIEGFAPEVCHLLLFFTSHFHLRPSFYLVIQLAHQLELLLFGR
jgi:prolyl-tRNA synthetase